MIRLCYLALLCVTVIGCDALIDRNEPAPRKLSPDAAVRMDGDPDESIPCQADADCPRSACGPCTPGEAFTRGDFRVDCRIDPCLGGGSTCGPEHVCVVSADTKKNPHAWCRACVDLEAASSSICADKGTATEIDKCATAVAEAVQSCDDATCKAAHEALENTFSEKVQRASEERRKQSRARDVERVDP